MIGNKQHYLIAGASGLVGSQLLRLLLDDPDCGKVTSLVRTSGGNDHPRLSEKVIDWDRLSEKDLPPTIDATFCCLGTTMAKAGGKDAYKKVDYDYVVKLAVFSQRKNIPQFHVISASGANPKAVFFYNRLKGRMEDELHKLTKIKSIFIYRPSLLLGDREEFRFGESIGKKFMTPFSFLLPRSIKAIYDLQVAMTMHHFAKSPSKGLHVISNARMHQLTA